MLQVRYRPPKTHHHAYYHNNAKEKAATIIKWIAWLIVSLTVSPQKSCPITRYKKIPSVCWKEIISHISSKHIPNSAQRLPDCSGPKDHWAFEYCIRWFQPDFSTINRNGVGARRLTKSHWLVHRDLGRYFCQRQLMRSKKSYSHLCSRHHSQNFLFSSWCK